MTNRFVLSWDCYGLESIIDIKELEHTELMTILRNPNGAQSRAPQVNEIVNCLSIRALFNPQRYYEIYLIETEDSISSDDIKQLFESDPQNSAELIRSRGTKIYSNRRSTDGIKIT